MFKTDKTTIDYIEGNINILRNLYDDLRVVDPITKKVILYKDGTFVENGTHCFCELNKKHICENCISIRALNTEKTCMKIENIDGKVFMITAVPFKYNNKAITVELTKEVTDSLFYGSCINGEESKFNNIICDMRKAAIKDSLTGVYNRRFIDERLPVDINRCINNNEPISIIMIDLDYFKKINDKFGHIGGDFILRKAAKYFKKCIRSKSDWIARYGGEEFLVCIPAADAKMALEVAERMHDYIADKGIYFKNEEINITASFGVCTISGKQITAEEFINLADEKLYEAKNSGRNKIVI